MKVIRILTGIALAFIITSTNGIAGYGYTVAGVFESGIGLWGTKEGEDSRVIVEVTEDGTKKFKPKDGLAALSLIASTKMGAFGIFLQTFVWFQFAAGILLLFKHSAGAILFTFLIFVAVGGLFAEIMGAILTSSFGVSNALGTIVAVMLGIVSFSMYRENSRGVAYDAP